MLLNIFDYITEGYSLCINLLLINIRIYGHLIKIVTKFIKILPNLTLCFSGMLLRLIPD